MTRPSVRASVALSFSAAISGKFSLNHSPSPFLARPVPTPALGRTGVPARTAGDSASASVSASPFGAPARGCATCTSSWARRSTSPTPDAATPAWTSISCPSVTAAAFSASARPRPVLTGVLATSSPSALRAPARVVAPARFTFASASGVSSACWASNPSACRSALRIDRRGSPTLVAVPASARPLLAFVLRALSCAADMCVSYGIEVGGFGFSGRRRTPCSARRAPRTRTRLGRPGRGGAGAR